VETGVFQKDIAKNQHISEKYLDPIISALKVSGLIKNIGGKKSGYTLNKPPSEISVYDVYKTFEPCLSVVYCLTRPANCGYEEKCVVKDYWMDLNDVIITHLKSTTLDTLIEQGKKKNIAKIVSE